MRQQIYSPGHPNTPVQGFADTSALHISSYENLHVNFSFDGLPFDGTDMLGSGPASSPSLTLEQSAWPGHLSNSQTETSFGSSLGLSTLADLKIENESPPSFSAACYAPTTLSSFNSGVSCSSPQTIYPLQTLANPFQDPSQYISSDWNNDSTADYEYTAQLVTPHMLSPMSPDMHEVHHFKSDPYASESPKIKPSVFHSPPRANAASSRRMKKEYKRARSLQKTLRCTDAGDVLEYSVEENAIPVVEGIPVSRVNRKFKCDHSGCKKFFARSEHQKRHLKTHDPTRSFPCLIEGCPAGGSGNGRVNRNDNANDHTYTHLKAWIASPEGSEERSRARNEPIYGKKNKSRNTAQSPQDLRRLILDRDMNDPERLRKTFNTLNRKASDDFGIHIDWTIPDCTMTRCEYAPKTKDVSVCNTCRQVRPKNNK